MEHSTGVWCSAVKKFSFLCFLMSLFCCREATATIEDIIYATCGVNGGTGVVFSQDKENYWIFTAGHCVVDEKGKERAVYLYFYHSGHRSKKIIAEVVWYKYVKKTTNDLAILKCPKKSLGRYPPPKIIPLARDEREIRTNGLVSSCGCAGSTWPTAWLGHIESIGADRFKIIPRPLPGRSGSSVFDRGGNHILGIIILQDGTAVRLSKIQELTKWKK